MTMKAFVAGIFLVLLVETQCVDWMGVLHFPGEAIDGARDMYRAYSDLQECNFKNADKYFHARGNYDAAQRGAGGRWAAKIISDLRETYQTGVPSGYGIADSEADQAANRHGRSGGDPNVYRPPGLPDKY